MSDEYIVIAKDDITELMDVVSSCIREGYSPVGGITVVSGEAGTFMQDRESIYFQSLLWTGND